MLRYQEQEPQVGSSQLMEGHTATRHTREPALLLPPKLMRFGARAGRPQNG